MDLHRSNSYSNFININIILLGWVWVASFVDACSPIWFMSVIMIVFKAVMPGCTCWWCGVCFFLFGFGFIYFLRSYSTETHRHRLALSKGGSFSSFNGVFGLIVFFSFSLCFGLVVGLGLPRPFVEAQHGVGISGSVVRGALWFRSFYVCIRFCGWRW